MATLMADTDIYRANFARFERDWADDPDWLQKLRQASLDRFLALGFPTTEEEDWRFTPLTSLVRTPFTLSPGSHEPVDWQAVERVSLPLPHSHRLVFINGRFAPQWSTVGPLPSGVFLGSLARAVQDHPYQVVPHLAQLANQEGHPFTALNTAFLHDGAFLYFPRGRVVEEPIVLLFVAVSPAKASFTSPRVLIVAEANSQARLVEDYVGLDQGVYFTNAVTELKAAEGAILDHYLLQRESPSGFHLGQIQARLERSSRLRAHSLNFGGQLVRNEIHVALAGEGSECSLNGLYLGRGQQLIDNHTRIDHARAHCTSHQLYKGILDGQARGVFCGRIHVHQDAQKTDARQTNQTLLLSNDALINTQPQLEIYADDVKCTHGATVGQLDTECLFYLRSRGLSETEARRLLVFAFANDIINRVEIEALRSRLEGDLLANQSLARPARAK